MLVVIIANYVTNEREGQYLRRAVDSLVQSTKCRPLIVDDGSPFRVSVNADWIQLPHSGDLTRSWNLGLRRARELGAEHICITNNDVIFADGWWHPMRQLLTDVSIGLVGPLTNAPGLQTHQDIRQYFLNYELSDSPTALKDVSAYVGKQTGISEGELNGFCFCGRASTFFDNAWDESHVFNPAFPLVGNENEFQKRLRENGYRTCAALNSFVFHYRSVARGWSDHCYGAYRPRICVYSAITNNYDSLQEDQSVDAGVDYICFTDKPLSSKLWQIRRCRPSLRRARTTKAGCSVFEEGYDVAIWIDGSMKLCVSPRQLVEKLGCAELAVFAHPFRNNVYDEAIACIRRRKDTPSVVRCQMARYFRESYFEHKLAETGVLIRRNTSSVREMNQIWTKEIENGSVRDQLSFNYSCWIAGLEYALLPGCGVDNEFTEYIGHRRSRRRLDI